MSKLVAFLALQEYIVLSRCDGRKRYYNLTDKGRSISAELVIGIDERLTAWYNKYMPLL
jgi:predicted transcriptional regulator